MSDGDCPYRLVFDLDYFEINVYQLDVRMDGDLGWLYNSILVPLSNALMDLFNDYMGDALIDGVIDMVNS